MNIKRQKAKQGSEKRKSARSLKKSEVNCKIESVTGLDSDYITEMILVF